MDPEDIYDQISIKVNKKRKSKTTKVKPTVTVSPRRVPIVSDLEYDTVLPSGSLSSKVNALNNKLSGPVDPIHVPKLDDKFSISSLQSVTSEMLQYQMSNGIILRSNLVPFANELLENFDGHLSRYFKSWFGQTYLDRLTTFRLYLYAVRFNQDRYVSDETAPQLLKILYVIFNTKQAKPATIDSDPSNSSVSVTKLSIPPFIFKRLGLPLPPS